jgi:hypothetical protein
VLALAALLDAAPHAVPGTSGSRALQRAAGSDRPTAVAVAASLLVQPLPAQLLKVRCDRAGNHRVCGLVVSGVKFHRALDRAAFLAEMHDLIAGAFAAAPIEEVDLWTTVPLDAGKGAVVSGDFARPSSATVFAVTVTRAELPRLTSILAGSRNVFWDPAFARERAAGGAR